MSKNHMVGEEVNVYERVKDRDVDVGDTIEVISDNQQGYRKYKVVNNLGKKGLKLIDSYDDWMGGRRKTRKQKRKSRKSRKNNKSKRKSHTRRSHKRKI